MNWKGEIDMISIKEEISSVKRSYTGATRTDIGTENENDILIKNYERLRTKRDRICASYIQQS